MRKRNILYIGGFELPDKNAAAHRVLANSKAIRDNGHNVILAGVDRNAVNSGAFLVQGFKCYSLKYPTSFYQWINYLVSIRSSLRIIKENNIDTIICYNYQSIAFFRLLQYAKKKRIQIYADCTEWYEPSGNLVFKLIKSVDVNLRMKYIQTRLNGLIVISDYLEEYYQRKGVTNIINVPPLVDLSDKKWPVLADDTAKENSLYNFIYSGSPGSGNKDKLGLVVENLKSYHITEKKKIIFNIVGITEEEYVKSFNNNVSLSWDYNFIKFHGRISHLDSLYLLAQADFSIFFRENNLTNRAGFPTKFVESISAGTPVITNASSNLQEYFSNDTKFIGLLTINLVPNQIKKVLEQALEMNLKDIRAFKLKCFDSKLFNYIKFKSMFQSLLESK